MDRVVCNTGPLIALSLIGRLDLLSSEFKHVLIPRLVDNEMKAAASAKPGLKEYLNAGFPIVSDTPVIDPWLSESLDAGEASVIALAVETQTAIVLIDERKARKVARNVFGLRTQGTVGLLVNAKRLGRIEKVRPYLEKLTASGYRLSTDLIIWALHEANEL